MRTLAAGVLAFLGAAAATAQESGDAITRPVWEAPPPSGQLPVPVATDPPPAAASPELSSFDWLERPNWADFDRNYPRGARRERVSGRVSLDCLITVDGSLDCTVASEDPAGYGFAAASLVVAREFKAPPRTANGRETIGSRVRVPFRWSLGR